MCPCWEWERKRTWDWAPGQVAVLQHCTATPCCNSSHMRRARVMDHGEPCGDCQETQGLSEAAGTLPGPPGMLAFWLCSPLFPPPLQGTVLHEHSQSACGPVGKVLCSEKDSNKPGKCWISFSSAGKGSRDSRRSLQTPKPGCLVRAERGEKAESTQPTQEHLQK